jgi:aminoglycoside phosphotransferase (APT) family kinase protein
VRRSPLELLLPEGKADGLLVLGDACPSVLVPRGGDVEAGEVVDLVILAPSRSQRRDAGWIRGTAAIASSRLSRAGMAYVVPGNARRLRRALDRVGLPHAATLLHVPDVRNPRYLVPLGTEAEHWALAGGIAMRRVKQLVATALGSSGRGAIGPTGAIHRRESSSPLAAWLHRLGSAGRGPAGETIVAMPHGGWDGAILYRFAAGGRNPDAVAKLTPRAREEFDALHRIAPHAGDAGARVPQPLAVGRLGSMPFVLESVVGGRPAATLVARRTMQPEELQRRVADFLEKWNRSSAHERPFGRSDVERFLLAPASRAGADGRYLEFLQKLGRQSVGRSCPFVPTHGDLTAANLLVDSHYLLAVVDWEHATEESLPLTDLLYAGVDAVAARGRYADRPGAFTTCFAFAPGRVSLLERLRSRAATTLGLDEIVQTVCFHACWLHHAANEVEKSTDPVRGPFVTILQTIARAPEHFGIPRGVQ